jgi:type VI protein secretion system component Hcp
LVYVKFQFHDVIIKSYRTGGGSDSNDLPIEHVSLDYQRMKYQYVEQDSSGSSLSKPEMFWDATQGKGSIS